VAGTYLIAGAATRGKITLHGIQMHNMEAVAELLRQMGAAIVCEKDTCYLDGRKAVRPLECVCTDTYPGFPTDLQSQLMAALCIAEGKSRIKEQIFEERFRIAAWLNRMGAKVVTDGREAVIHGVKRLQGMTVEAQELRGGAALVLAGLIAEGKTQVYGSSFIERGYEDLAGDLRLLGAVVSRKTTER
ncbi:MAG: UDP-N-acetylglucosamine 1-carboxyvinyltransferase, partial [Lachnospiraceae bacterium]|nr:UDP-N-acetylglucosamine 1-carboxyvinyltransferase [Lachnospiraceae bacterium]